MTGREEWRRSAARTVPAGILVTLAALAALAVPASCSSKKGAAATTTTTVTPAPTTVAGPTTTEFDKAAAERQVRAAYQNFRVKLRELLAHPDPASPIIDQVWTREMAADVRSTQAKNAEGGYHAVPSKRTRWRILSLRLTSHATAIVHDCYVNGDIAMRHSRVTDSAVNTYEIEIGFQADGGFWRVVGGSQIKVTSGVAGCALAR